MTEETSPRDVHIPPQQQRLLALGQLAGGMAHDFNNILSIIEGYARMLQRELGDDPVATEKLSHIQLATRRGAGLTKQLLSFGRQSINPGQSCDLCSVVQDTVHMLHPLLTARISLSVTMPEQPVRVSCDADIITQILINLATNARDAIGDAGRLDIKITTKNDRVYLTVEDDGCGIPKNILSKIFDPFFTTKDQGKGTGLGLAAIAGEMSRVGGGVHVDSTVDEGTCFTLEFPRMADDDEIPTRNPLIPDTTEPQQKTILVVDDEEEFLPIIEDDLKRMGYKVLKSANADSALVLQAEYPDSIDLLLTDVVMPGMSGVKLAEQFSRARPDAGVVFMTGYPSRGADSKTNFPKDAMVLPKPLALDQVSAALHKALDQIK